MKSWNTLKSIGYIDSSNYSWKLIPPIWYWGQICEIHTPWKLINIHIPPGLEEQSPPQWACSRHHICSAPISPWAPPPPAPASRGRQPDLPCSSTPRCSLPQPTQKYECKTSATATRHVLKMGIEKGIPSAISSNHSLAYAPFSIS